METKVSDKYIAGLIDSDGCISLKRIKAPYKPLIYISIAQRSDRAEVLTLCQKSIGGGVIRVRTQNGVDYSELTVIGSAAHVFLARISKYLVIKRTHCLWCLDKSTQYVEDESLLKKQIKLSRKVKSLPLPNFPSRKWLAGYIDGDGCIRVNYLDKNNLAKISCSVACHVDDSAGVEIIQKNFGGNIGFNTKTKTVLVWQKYFSNNHDALKFFEYFGKHCIIKRDQITAVLEYLRADQKNGQELDKKLRQLKTTRTD